MRNVSCVVKVMLCVVLLCSALWVEAAVENGFKIGYQHNEGYKAGLFYSINLGSGFSLQPELYFSQREYKYGDYPTCYGVSDEIAFCPQSHYGYDAVRFIEVPVLFKYRFNLRGNFKPVILAGAYAAFRVSPGKVYDDDYWWSLYRTYEDVDAGLIAGIGFEHQMKNIKVHYDFRYNFGLVEVQKVWRSFVEVYGFVPGGDAWVSEKRKTSSFSLLVGVSF